MTMAITRNPVTLALSSLVLLSSTAQAGQIAELFKAGVFGLSWNASRDEVAQKYPGGSWVNRRSVYTVRDDRSVLGVERGKRNHIAYSFDKEGRLVGVTVYFPFNMKTTSDLTLAAERAFGEHLANRDDQISERTSLTESTGFRWPRDDGIEVSLVTSTVGFLTSIDLNIINYSGGAQDRQSLGFE
jgi:hypothetical protein